MRSDAYRRENGIVEDQLVRSLFTPRTSGVFGSVDKVISLWYFALSIDDDGCAYNILGTVLRK